MARRLSWFEHCAVRFTLFVFFSWVLCGYILNPVDAASPSPRGYTWMLSLTDFAAGEFTQTDFAAGQLRPLNGYEGSYITPAHRAPFSFFAAGVDWQADLAPGAEVVLELRLSRDGQLWDAWQPVEGEPQDHRWFGENLIILEGAQWMQARLTLRGDARVVALNLTAIDASGVPTLDQVLAQAVPLAGTAAVPAPHIISRSAWGADESMMTWPPQYAPARKIVIHHTVTSGGDDPAAEVRAIYYYHAITRGWGDIGYNYLIDKYGNIYEGRFGGLDVIAGHTYGYNVGSVGIGNLGNYTTAAPTSPMLESNAALAAWYGERNFIHPLESSFFVDMVTPNITGHRDYAATTCPGSAFYSQLPAIRARAWDILRAYLPSHAAAYLSHNTPQMMLVGSTVEVRHTLRNTGVNTWYRLSDPTSHTPYHLGYHWYDATGLQYVQPPAEDHRASLPADIPFGATTTIPTALLTAPHEPGVYTLKWDMVHEGMTWFATQGSPTLDIVVAVTYPATLTGSIRDNRGAGVSGAQVALMGGTRVDTGATGAYTFAGLFPGVVTLQAFEPGALHFPNGDPVYDVALFGGASTEVMLVLRPFDNVIHNGGFEAGLNDWIATSLPAGGVIRTSNTAHTGRGSVELAAQQSQRVEVQQTVRLPLDVVAPTLSIMYTAPAADVGDVLRVLVETTSGAVTHTLPYSVGWQHWWADIAAVPGEPVTITVYLQSDADTMTTAVFLDEITLGSGGVHGWRYQRAYIPLQFRETTPE